MFLHQLRLLLRTLRRQRVFTGVNLLGLALAMLAALFIGDFVYHELRYDEHHSKADRIFRISMHNQMANGYDMHWARLTTDFVNELPEVFPEVEALVRFQDFRPRNVRVGQEVFKEEQAYTTDAEAFAVFDFPLLAGDPATALADPFSVVLTEDTAIKYFGTTQVVGRTVEMMGSMGDAYVPYTVSAVMENVPGTTHMPIALLSSFERPEARTGWAYTYVLLHEPTDAAAVAAKLPGFVAKHLNGPGETSLPLTPLTDIHLHSQLAREIEPGGAAWIPPLFSAVAIFILLVALINYMNLSLAQRLARAREVGVRKVLGSSRARLVRQFLGESIGTALLAALLAGLVLPLFMPGYRQLAGFAFSLPMLYWMGGLLAMAIVMGLGAGLYPAWRLSRFAPVQVLKGGAWSAGPSPRLNLRHVLVGVQFAISLTLLVCAGVAYQQNQYLAKKDLGFDTEQVLAIQQLPSNVQQAYPTLKESLLQDPNVVEVSAVMEMPSREIRDAGSIYAAGKQTDPESSPIMDIQVVDRGYVEMMGMELVAGADFPASLLRMEPPKKLSGWQELAAMLAEQPQAYLLNETAVRQAGWETPEEALGQEFGWSNGALTFAHGPVVGVVKDFHQESLHNAIDPIVMVYEPQLFNYLLVKTKRGGLKAGMTAVQGLWQDRFPELPLDVVFLDEEVAQLYRAEAQQMQLIAVFTGLAVAIACLGLLGMLAYTLRLRASELAIRRVLGAEARSLLWLLGKEYVILLVVSLAVALPVAGYLTGAWLEGFSYHVSLSGTPFLVSLVILATVVASNLGIQVLHHLGQRPAKTLRE